MNQINQLFTFAKNKLLTKDNVKIVQQKNDFKDTEVVIFFYLRYF